MLTGNGSIFIYQRYPANSCSFRWSMFWPHPGGSATSISLLTDCATKRAAMMNCQLWYRAWSVHVYGSSWQEMKLDPWICVWCPSLVPDHKHAARRSVDGLDGHRLCMPWSQYCFDQDNCRVKLWMLIPWLVSYLWDSSQSIDLLVLALNEIIKEIKVKSLNQKMMVEEVQQTCL